MAFIQGTTGNDPLVGTSDHDLINGLQGNDTISGDDGDDLIRPGTGDDIVDGGSGYNRISYYGAGGDTIASGVTVTLLTPGMAQATGGAGNDTLSNIQHVTGSIHDDVLTGDGGDNWLWGGFDPDANGGLGGPGGNEIISAGGGNDLVEVGAGNHALDGGADIDALSFFSAEVGSTSGVTFSLALQGAAQATGQGNVTASGFERLSGTAYGDMLSGDGDVNFLAGDLGDDTLLGGGGDDALYGDGRIAPDTNGTGYSGPITIYNDVAASFSLTAGNDWLDGGAGNDLIDGGGGSDTASFASWGERVIASLNPSGNGFASNEAGTETDTLVSVENLSGSAFNDSLNGNDFDNVLSGEGGHDLLFGRGGADTLIGGADDDFLRGSDGDDMLNGGTGWDRVSNYLAAPTVGVTINLNVQGVAQNTNYGMDTLIGIEHASGTILNDTLTGDANVNWLWDGSDGIAGGGSGNDTISAGGGNDLVESGGGDDLLDGGAGVDALSFLGGQNEITAAGIVFSLALQGGAQATAQGNITATGFENLSGSIFGDGLTGDNGANLVLGDRGDDILSGGNGDDRLYGDGRLHIDSHGTGGSGPITLWNDVTALEEIAGGNDTLLGGKGDDQLWGGQGNDILTGDQGRDTFAFSADSGDDRITDFGNLDTILFDALSGVDDFSDLIISALGRDTLIEWGTSDSITLDGVRPRSLDSSDFVFEGAAASAMVSAREDVGAALAHGSSFGSQDLAAAQIALDLSATALHAG
ncbi:beta strand repeat-containing protein [Sphingomonas mesophila]|uniref:beta strand repeat-containing protein n=1 Tax=Sphingomonas mesophila TaxID=2303576 RepID=UPI000E585212|nr:calcium-binding protein [Sphingomonas mesophila]